MSEIWKDIPEYENIYQVSSTGRIRSVDRIDALGNHRKGAIMKQKTKCNGYNTIALCKNGKYKFIGVHRLVAQAFLPNPNNLPQVNHKDENPSNNRVENLEWCDAKYNTNYGTRNVRASKTNSLTQRGRKNPWLCKKIAQLDLDENIIRIYNSITDAANKNKISQSSLSGCLIGKNKTAGGYKWKYVN